MTGGSSLIGPPWPSYYRKRAKIVVPAPLVNRAFLTNSGLTKRVRRAYTFQSIIASSNAW